MNRTPIDWVKNPDGTQGYTWNPITGCLNHTPEGLCLGGLFPCYAWKLANRRLRERYLANINGISPFERDGKHLIIYPSDDKLNDPFYPRFWPERMACQFSYYGKRQGIFVCDMSDMFGIGIPEQWTRAILKLINAYPQHRFYLLTKQPQNLVQWSPFSPNCEVGVTATDRLMWFNAIWQLQDVKATVKFLSFEPLLNWQHLDKEPIDTVSFTADWFRRAGINQVIIGACTGRKSDLLKLQLKYPDLILMSYGRQWTLQPQIEWVEEIVRAADKAGIPVFLKTNLAPALEVREPFIEVTKDYRRYPRQEVLG